MRDILMYNQNYGIWFKSVGKDNYEGINKMKGYFITLLVFLCCRI